MQAESSDDARRPAPAADRSGFAEDATGADGPAMSRSLLCSIAAALIAAAAPLAAQTTTSMTTTSRAGVGASLARPVGAWTLPAGIELARPITGYSVFMPEDCAPAEEAEGSGDLVRICLALRNRSANSVTVVIPSGLILISEDDSVQNGIIVKSIRREIGPGEAIFIPAYAMCLNSGRSGSHPGASYVLGPVLDDPGFNRLFRLLENRRVPREGAVELQAAVWALSDGGPIPASAEAWIAALPQE